MAKICTWKRCNIKCTTMCCLDCIEVKECKDACSNLSKFCKYIVNKEDKADEA